MADPTIDEARRAKEVAKQQLARINGVLLAGIGLTRRDGVYAVKVNLVEPTTSVLPRAVLGVPLVFEVVGSIEG